MASFIKETYTSNTKLTVYWGEKLMPDLTSKEHIERLPILVLGRAEK